MMQFNTYKQQWLESILQTLWTDWAKLGVAGYTASSPKGTVDHIIDPEALILITNTFGRWDARLFDEMLSWLALNGDLINVKRLQGLSKKFPYPEVLSAIAVKTSPHHSAWARLEANHASRTKLFYLTPAKPLPLPENIDPEFEHAGLLRAPFHDRKMAAEWTPHEPAASVLKLRSLFGINAHAEVLNYYADGRKVHASKAAKDLGFSQRGIQEILTQMTRGGGMKTFTDGRKKLFQINPLTWTGLLPADLQWKNSTSWGALQCHLWSLLHHVDTPKTLVLSSVIRSAQESTATQFPEFSDNALSSFKAEEYIEQWLQWHRSITEITE
ncbi:hypothetical protein [Rubritalea marina]|uniref:hypothetical protein n=1 Tax=Rubritalea marina TaxID=361055 RepID=UPI00039A56AC|nr:hypothetical protein [Rubritalea marina]